MSSLIIKGNLTKKLEPETISGKEGKLSSQEGRQAIAVRKGRQANCVFMCQLRNKYEVMLTRF